MSKRKQKILGELGFTYAGLSGKTQKDFGRGKPFIPFMNIMSNGKIDPKFMGLVAVAPNERQNAVQKGDLFFTTSSETPEEVGMTSVLLDDIGECYLNSFCFGFRLFNFDDLLPEFAPYLFRGNAVRKQIISLGQGYTRFNLPKTELLKKLKLELPSEPEQRKISEILTRADSIIEKTQAAISKYNAIKQGMLQDLFTRGIDLQSGKLRPRYKDAPELYKESKLGWIPRDWEVEEFQNVCSLITDGSHFSPRPQEDGELIVNVKDMGEYDISYSSCTRISIKDFEFLTKQNCSPIDGDILLSKDGTIGKTLLFNENRKVVLLSSIAILRPSNILNSAFFYTYFKSHHFENELRVKISGTAIKRIVLKAINTLNIILPKTLEEQTLISERILSIDSKLQTEQIYLQKMQSLKKGLMEDLLSGRKQVKVEEELVTQIED